MKRFHRILSTLLAAVMIVTILPLAAFAAVDLSEPGKVVSVQVNVTYGQTEARKMLDYINNFRTGKTDGTGGTTNPPQMLDENGNWIDCPDLQPMTYDYELEKIAMQRAAEIAIRFAHQRPNGKKCGTAFGNSSLTYYGENIAAGNTDAMQTFLQWREDDEPYSGQGHRRNMLRAENLVVGIGHAVYQGHHFWVQEFAPQPRKENPKTKANNAQTTVPVEIKTSLLQTGDADTAPAITLAANMLEVPFGGSVKAPVASFAFYLKDVWPEKGSSYGSKSLADVTIKWESSNPEIAAVEKGTVKGIAPGTAQLTGSFLGEALTVDVTVKCSHVPAERWDKDASGHWHTCTKCGALLDKTEHTFGDWTITQPATCTQPGVQVRSCSVCGFEETGTVPAAGHTMTAVARIEPSCTQSGTEGYFTCSICGGMFADEAGTMPMEQPAVLPALGHDWNKPVYTFAEDGSVCTAKRICKRDTSHTETAAAVITSAQTKAPTCTQPGETTYTATFAESWAESQSKVIANIPATGTHTFGPWTDLDAANHQRVCTGCQAAETAPHTFGEWTVVTEATESKTGQKKRTCTACGREETAEIPVKAHVHQLTAVAAKTATCTEPGNVAYWHCAICNKNFADDKAVKELTDVVVPALGHDWDQPTYEWSADGKTCTAKHICNRDKTHAETAAAVVTFKQTKLPTCTEKGTVTCTAAFAEIWAKPQTKEIEQGEALGHDWDAAVYEWSADGKTCTAKRTCKRDKAHTETAAAKIASAQSKAPTCSTPGETTYAAVFDVPWAAPQAKVVADVACLPHTLTHYPKISSTCVKQGTAEHWTCSVCHKMFTDEKAQKEVSAEALKLPLAAHTYTETITRQPTYTQTGIKTYTCKVCGHSYTKEIPIAAPSYDWLPAYAAIAAQKPGGKVTIDVGREIAIPNGVWQAFYGKDITVTLKRGLDSFVFNGLDLQATGFDPDNGHNLTDLMSYIGRKYPKPTTKPTEKPTEKPENPEPSEAPVETEKPKPTEKPVDPTPAVTEKPAEPEPSETKQPAQVQPEAGFNWIWLLIPIALAIAVGIIIISFLRSKNSGKH